MPSVFLCCWCSRRRDSQRGFEKVSKHKLKRLCRSSCDTSVADLGGHAVCNPTYCRGSFYPAWVGALLSEARLEIAQQNLLSVSAAASLH